MSNITFFQTIFDVQVTLCDRYTALNILDLRQRSLHEVILLFNRTIDWFKRKDNKSPVKTKPNKIVRKAGDNWF